MPRDVIGAEIVPVPGKAIESAKALQKLGFKVLHLGNTSVSVEGPEAIWQQNFPVTFEVRTKRPHANSAGQEVSYRRPLQDPVPIPVGLHELIASVAFVEPPEFF
jgi:hypothetical protein